MVVSIPNTVNCPIKHTVMAARLPTPRNLNSAVLVGTDIYIFGGLDPTGFIDEIVRYDPVTGDVTIMEDTLLSPLARRL